MAFGVLLLGFPVSILSANVADLHQAYKDKKRAEHKRSQHFSQPTATERQIKLSSILPPGLMTGSTIVENVRKTADLIAQSTDITTADATHGYGDPNTQISAVSGSRNECGDSAVGCKCNYQELEAKIDRLHQLLTELLSKTVK
jgi:hypothetical protein